MPAVPALKPVVPGILVLALALTGCTVEESRGGAGSTNRSPTATATSTPEVPQSPASSPRKSKQPSPHQSAVPAALRPAYDGKPARPRTPRQAAAMIEAAQRVIRAGKPARLLTAAGHTEQLAVREISGRKGWLPKVLAALPAGMRWQTRANVAARQEFRSMHPSRPKGLSRTLPSWRIVEPAPPRVLMRSYREAERRYGIDWEYLAAINLVETAFGRIRGTSVAGAQGPMQFIPGTWEMYGEGGDVNDAHDAILAAARLLRANGFERNKGDALWRYNNHRAYVRGVTHHAEVMARDPRQFRGYLAWQVYYLTQRGSVWLPTGYEQTRKVPVTTYLERHPEHLP